MSEFSDRELRAKIDNPLVFQYSGQSKNINNAHGFDITVIVDIGKALIDAKNAGTLPSSRTHSAKSGIKGVGYALAGYRPEVQEVIDAFKAFVREEARQHIGKLLGVAAMSESKDEYEAGIEKVFGRMKPDL